MAKKCYDPTIKFSEEKLKIIAGVNQVIKSYRRMGYTLSVRQVYYQFVSQGWIPNQQEWYDKLQEIIGQGRLAGLIDWGAIVDRTRFLRGNSHYTHPIEIVRSAKYGYQIDKWKDQPNHVEVWIEKDALVDIIANTCTKLDVNYYSCRGYASITELHDAATRFRNKIEEGKEVHIIQMSDHDPSGIHMSHNISERIKQTFGVPIKLHRIALNMDQVEEYDPPDNPAKTKDPRFRDYNKRFGDKSWELDALNPVVLNELVEANIRHWMDEGLWNARKAAEEKGRNVLDVIESRWNEVMRLLRKPPQK